MTAGPATTAVRSARARIAAGSVFVGVMVAIAAVAAWPIYRSWWFVLLVISAAGVAALIAVVARLRRWSGAVTAAACGVAFLLVGVPLAVPSRIGGAPDLLRGFVDLLAGTVLAWKDLITVDLPVGTYRNLLVPALVVFLGGTCAALVLSWRADRAAYAAAPVTLGMVFFGLIFGRASTSAALPLGPVHLYAPLETAVGIAGLVAMLMWLAWRGRDERVRALERAASSGGVRMPGRRSAADRRRAALGAGLVVFAIVGVVAVVPFAARGADRSVLRTAAGPEIDLAAEVSPLATYRAFFDDARADDVLFRVAVQDGAPSRVRLATLDSYDGEVFRSGGADSVDQAHFVRVPAALDPGPGDPVRARFVIDGLTGIWMPTAGRVASVEFSGDRASALAEGFYYSASAAAGLQTAGGGLAPGDAFVVSGADPEVPDVAALQPPGVPAGALPLPESLAAWVKRHQAGAGGAALDGLVRLLRERGYLSHALSMGDTPARWAQSLPGYAFQPSAAGHSLARVDAMFASLLARESAPQTPAPADLVAAIGDDEQFSVAVALIAQDLGFPARVVIGVRLGSAEPTLPTCAEGVCRAQDVAAWTEVQNATGTWVPIDVTPQFETPPDLDVSRQRDPENVTDVLPETVHEVLPPQPVQQDSAPDEAPPDDGGADLAWLWPTLRIAGIAALLCALAFGPFVAVIAAKAARRRGRRGAHLPADRIAGGWEEYVDAATDAGRDAPGSLTRSELAAVYATASGARLASAADQAVFSAEPATEADAAAFWSIVDAERRGIRAEKGFWRGLRATVSLRSFVRHLAPVTGRRDRTAERGPRRTAASERISP